MKRALIAAVGGMLLGLSIYFELSDQPVNVQPLDTGHPEATATDLPERPHATVFADTQHPGLVVSVSRDGRAEPGVQVLLFRAEPEVIKRSIRWVPAGEEHTDESGRCAMPALTGSHLVIATATDGRKSVRQFEIAAAGEETLLALTLEESRRITGRVVDAESKQPLANATVHVMPTAEHSLGIGVATTDSLGRFSIDVPPFDEGSIEARAPRHVHGTMPIIKTTTEVELLLGAGVLVDGRTIDTAGEPVAHVAVHLEPGELESLSSDDSGRFQVLVPHGTIVFHAIANDGRQALERLSVREGEHATITLSLATGTSLSGVVHGAGPGIEVNVVAEPHGPTVATLTPGADGRFEARSLPAGRYSVLAHRGPGARASLIGIDVPHEAPLELTLSDDATVTGLVLTEGNVPVGGATVTAQWSKRLGELTRTVRTTEDGRFAFGQLPPGEVTLSASMGQTSSYETRTYVAPGSNAEVTLSLAARGRLSGMVLTKNPMQDVTIIGDTTTEHVQSSANGMFGLELPAGSYRVVVAPSKDEMAMANVEIRAGEDSVVQLRPEGTDGHFPHHMLHPQLGSGLSFENAAGGVKIDFLMNDCPASRAGLKMGDVVVSIDGAAARDASDAFSRVRKSQGEELQLIVRREGQDVLLTVK